MGCKTPTIVRRDGDNGECKFVGDAFVDMYMYGMAIADWKRGDRELKHYVCS